MPTYPSRMSGTTRPRPSLGQRAILAAATAALLSGSALTGAYASVPTDLAPPIDPQSWGGLCRVMPWVC